jgi:hypothetical protein
MSADRSTDPAQEFAAWLEQQRDFLSRLAKEQDPSRMRAELAQWWQQASARSSPQAQDLAGKLLDLGQSYLQGLQQFAQSAAASQQGQPGAATGMHGDAQPSFNFGLDLLAAWRNARLGADFTGLGTAGAFAAPWLDALSKLPPIGPSADYIDDARELAGAHAECQRLEEALTHILQRVQSEALADMQERVSQRTQSGEPIQNFRQLYDLWIECGERAYGRAAHSAEFAKLQADLTNGLMRLRSLQRRVAERAMRKLDLPTRAELNTLHLQVRDLRRKLSQFEAAAAPPAARPANADRFEDRGTAAEPASEPSSTAPGEAGAEAPKRRGKAKSKVAKAKRP